MSFVVFEGLASIRKAVARYVWSVASFRKMLFPLLIERRRKPPLLHRLMSRGGGVEFVPFNELFAEVEKSNWTAPRVVPTPEAACIEMEPGAVPLKSGTYTIPEDYVAELHNVYYTPVGNVVFTSAKKIIQESSNEERLGYFLLRDFYRPKVEEVPGYCTPWRTRYHNYFHLLIDSLPRLLALEASPFADVEEIRLLTPEPLSETSRFFLSALRMDNLRVELLDGKTIYKLEKLLFTPLKVQNYTAYLPQTYRERLRSRLLPDRPSTRGKRIYVSRKGARRRRVENEAELVATLNEWGFESVQLEDLSPQAQIELFYDAEAVVGAHGAGLTNLLFAHQASVIELFPTCYVRPHFYYLCKAMGHDYAYWCSERQRSIHTETFRVDVPAVRRLLARLDVGAPLPGRVPSCSRDESRDVS